MGGRAPGTLQSGHLHSASAQLLQSYSVRTARIPARHLCPVRAGTQCFKKLKREPNRTLLHLSGPGCPGGQFHHRWCGCRHLPVHRWTAVLITLQPPLRKSWTDEAGKERSQLTAKPKRFPIWDVISQKVWSGSSSP